MNTALVIGASGQVGEHLMQTLGATPLKVFGTYQSHYVPGFLLLNIINRDNVLEQLGQLKPNIVFLPASLTNVDYCELHPQDGFCTNVVGVKNVVEAVNILRAKLVYFSSDYIFDGENGPYREDDPANPICEYGRQKLMAEHYISLWCKNYLIIRTTVVYGWERQGKNFIYRLINTLNSGQVLRVPFDQVGSPTYAPNLAQAVIELSLKDAQGVYHLVGPKRVNRYEFACEAARVFGLDETLIQRVATAELNQKASRPLNAGMIVEKAQAKLSTPLLDYRVGLRTMAAERVIN